MSLLSWLQNKVETPQVVSAHSEIPDTELDIGARRHPATSDEFVPGEAVQNADLLTGLMPEINPDDHLVIFIQPAPPGHEIPDPFRRLGI